MKNIIFDNNYKINIHNKNIDIFNYKRIYDISSNNIVIKLDGCMIRIKGSSLIVNKMDETDISISGVLKEISFNYE